MSTRKTSEPALYQLKITIRDISPPIWRRLIVPGSITLDRLHAAIQIAFGWQSYHMHEFIIGSEYYGTLQGGSPDAADNGRKVRLADLVKLAKSKFIYHYDFGDDWRHDVVVEKLLPSGGATATPVCAAGKRHGPPEDCGGPWGYQELLNALASRKHNRNRELREWMGGPYNPEAFSLNEINRQLNERYARKAPRART